MAPTRCAEPGCGQYPDICRRYGHRRAFDPKTDPRACSQCKNEDVVEIEELVPSGRYRKIRCANGHVTHGMPTRAYFEETS